MGAIPHMGFRVCEIALAVLSAVATSHAEHIGQWKAGISCQVGDS
jgi:hypothetical protein